MREFGEDVLSDIFWSRTVDRKVSTRITLQFCMSTIEIGIRNIPPSQPSMYKSLQGFVIDRITYVPNLAYTVRLTAIASLDKDNIEWDSARRRGQLYKNVVEKV